MLVRSGVLDHALRRRAVLLALRSGRLAREDACDAGPELLGAAAFDGRPSAVPCPVCRGDGLRVVSWVWGRSAALRTGRSATPAEVAGHAAALGSVTLHEVEVCTRCGWNHLLSSCTLTDAPDRAATG